MTPPSAPLVPPAYPPSPATDHRLLRRYIWFTALVWTAILGISLYLNIRLQYDNAYVLARNKAVDNFNKDLSFRLWLASRGGMYLDVAAGATPLRYLDFLPDRDLNLADGRTLTLYDPASALKQAQREHPNLYGILGRIVSEKPLNPANTPDPWESAAIRSFRRGVKESFTIADMQGKPHMRLMRPMVMLGPCLKCHDRSGYRQGDMVAGIGIAVPMEEFLLPAREAARTHAQTHGTIWLLGLAGIGFVRRRVGRHLEERLLHLGETELSARVFEDGLQAIAITDSDGRILRANPMFLQLTGYDAGEILGRNIALLESPQHSAAFFADLWRELRLEGSWMGEVWTLRKGGESFPAWESISAVADETGRPRHYIFMFQDISERKQFMSRLEQIAHYDPLTHLPNRYLLSDRVDHALRRTNRQISQLALLFIDLDQFKKINDTLGHHAGDQLLVTVARRLTDCVRACDTLARLGGDEFALLLEDIGSPGDAERVAEKILAAMAAPMNIDGREWYLGASIGISMSPRDGSDLQTLLKSADTAMYRAKSEGRNRYCFFNEDMASEAALYLAKETALRLAKEHQSFSLHYQPQMDLASGDIIGVETLIRWRHGDTMIPPMEFIPLAEETGLIVPIGRWLLRTACRDIAALRDAGHPNIKLSVNISAVELNQPDFVDQVKQALAESGLPPESLELEITESTMMVDMPRVNAVLDAVAALGVSLAIDDFGTGYSSLAYLKQLPVDYIKVDRSFVRGVPLDREDSTIVRAIITMSRTLGLQVVAEGVETEEQKRFLHAEGCDLIQGYLIARPLPLDELRAWLTLRRA